MTLIDRKIGKRLEQLRKSYGLSQIELAEKVGISFQQIQKYEKGITRISVYRLQQISDALGIRITEFFEENKILKVSSPATEYIQEENYPKYFRLINKEEFIVLKLFRKIKNKKLREGLLKQIRGIIELEKIISPH